MMTTVYKLFNNYKMFFIIHILMGFLDSVSRDVIGRLLV